MKGTGTVDGIIIMDMIKEIELFSKVLSGERKIFGKEIKVTRNLNEILEFFISKSVKNLKERGMNGRRAISVSKETLNKVLLNAIDSIQNNK